MDTLFFSDEASVVRPLPVCFQKILLGSRKSTMIIRDAKFVSNPERREYMHCAFCNEILECRADEVTCTACYITQPKEGTFFYVSLTLDSRAHCHWSCRSADTSCTTCAFFMGKFVRRPYFPRSLSRSWMGTARARAVPSDPCPLCGKIGAITCSGPMYGSHECNSRDVTPGNGNDAAHEVSCWMEWLPVMHACACRGTCVN